MSISHRSWTITLRDGARVTLRPIAPEDKSRLAASFARLSVQSRYRRFLTNMDELPPALLDYLVDIDHRNHEAVIAIEPSSGEALGVARYIRSKEDAEVAEVAVTVSDDWQRRGLGRALLDRLTYRARREGVRRFSALVMGDNREAVGLLETLGDTQRHWDTGVVELLIDLPPRRGMGIRLARALQAAAGESLVPARTLAQLAGFGIDSPPRPLGHPARPIRTIAVGVDGSETAGNVLAVALMLAAALGSALHIVGAHTFRQAPGDAEAVLRMALQAARLEGVEAVAHARSEDSAEALIAVAREHDADLVVVGSGGMNRALPLPLSNMLNEVSHQVPWSVLIVPPMSATGPRRLLSIQA